jgi:outer membrane lipoprotein-sorting protein
MRSVLVLSCICLLGCAGAGTLRPANPISDARVALQRSAATIEGLHSIRAEARVDQRASSGRIKGTVLMFVEDSGRVRFDVMTQFGPIAILTSDGEKFAYSDLREKRFLYGQTCPENIARLLGVPLSAEETARFLLGGTPVIEHSDSAIIVNDAGHYQLTLKGETGGKQQLELAVYPGDEALPPAQQRLKLVRSELWNPSGQSVWRVSYDDYEAIQLQGRQLLVPKRVQIEQSAQKADTLVSFKKITTNPEIPAEAFTQTARPGMQEEEAPCDEAGSEAEPESNPDPEPEPQPE